MGSVFQRYRNLIILVLLLIYALAQGFSIGIKEKYEQNLLEKVIVTITSPPQQLFTYLIDQGHQFWLDYIFLVNARKNYRELLNRHRDLKLKMSILEEERRENQRLRTLLGLSEQLAFDMIAARVISFGSSSFTHSVRIDKGLKQGIRSGMPVITSDGVVGHVINTTGSYANVLLLIDPNSHIDVLNQTTRARGIVQGQSTFKLSLEFLTRQREVNIDDPLVTSGLDAIYPKGLRVGTISSTDDDPSTLFINATVEPAVNFARLEEVLVITNAQALRAKEEIQPTP